MLKKALENVLSQSESAKLFSAFDQIGDIIVIRIPESLLAKKKIIGKTLLEKVKTANSVYCQSSAVEGNFRTRDLELVAGQEKTLTEYTEFGCRFLVDVKKAFFSPRLSTERNRISELIQDGEVVINMFGGIGMFSIIAAKNKNCTVYNIDINPEAAKLCDKNIKLNKLKGNVISIPGDTSKIIKEELGNKGDRVLMLLPDQSDEFLSTAISAAKTNGIIHYYSHIHADKKSDAAKLSEKHYMEITTVESEILNSKIVRAVGPHYYQTVLDVRIRK